MSAFDPARFAIIADIHGNADALRAVLADIDAQGVAHAVNLGDHVSGPMAARETADLLMARDFPSIRGNHDRWVLDADPAEMTSVDVAARAQLDDAHLDWLRGLPATLAPAEEVFLCHGTPISDETYWMEAVAPDGQVVPRPRAEVEAEARGLSAGLLLCGHTHMPRRLDLADGRVLLNPGSVGCPAYQDDLPVPHRVQTGSPAACYAIAERVADGWSTSFRHVPYDPARMIRLAHEADHPHWQTRLATGWVD
ncbi:MAG: metallophosphoesterase family protein [Pseudomonadota bacterium]